MHSPEMTETTNVISFETGLWHEAKAALVKIDQASDDILAQWVIVGDRLTQIKQGNQQRHGGAFLAAVSRFDITLGGKPLTGQQVTAAQWWAQLPEEWRDKLHAEHPDALLPESLQRMCRDSHPQMARIGAKPKFGSSENGKVARKNEKTPSAEDQAEGEKKVKLSAKEQKRIAEEEHREEIRARRERREREQARRAAEDRRPCVIQGTVVMYGVQLWPIKDEDRARLGYYDYDQLFFGLQQFKAWLDLLRTEEPGERAYQMRTRLKPLQLFAQRRLEQQCQTEVLRVLDVMRTLADLYAANPTGECRFPFDNCMR
jgi:hypothetical protein